MYIYYKRSLCVFPGKAAIAGGGLELGTEEHMINLCSFLTFSFFFFYGAGDIVSRTSGMSGKHSTLSYVPSPLCEVHPYTVENSEFPCDSEPEHGLSHRQR